MRNLTLLFLLMFGVSALFAQESKKAYNAGVTNMKAKKYAEAVKDFQNAANEAKVEGRDDTDIGKYIYYAGYAAHKGKDFKTAVAYLDTAIQKKSKVVKSYLMMADGYKALEDNENYLKTLENGAKAKPKEADFPIKLGLYYYGIGAEHKGEAAKLTESNPAKCKTELNNAKAEFEKAEPSLKTAKSLLEAKIPTTTKAKKKAGLEKDLEKVTTALNAIKTSKTEIAEAIKALDQQ